MTRLSLRSDDRARVSSTLTLEAKSMPGARFTISRISFGRRMELSVRIRELARRFEFRDAGDSVADRAEANILACEIDQLYLRWGLVGVEGLRIDGEKPDIDMLINRGPEPLCREIVGAIKSECGLSEEERKN